MTELDDLDLTNNRITDAGLANLTGLIHLSSLRLGATKVTDAGLVHLKGLHALELLDLNAAVTDAGVRGLEEALPKCKVRR